MSGIFTPTCEVEEISKDECYSCSECNSTIEIQDLDAKNNFLSFQCYNHGLKTMSIKDYFETMPKNTFYYSECSNCKKKQNEVNKQIFHYCFNCKLILCHQCIFNHNKEHIIIDNNKLNIKCPIHPKNNNKNYCFDCNVHLCEECLLERKHMMHKKINIIEIKPSNEELDAFLNLIEEYRKSLSKAEIDKQNQLNELETKFNEDKENAKTEYNQTIINTKNKLEKMK